MVSCLIYNICIYTWQYQHPTPYLRVYNVKYRFASIKYAAMRYIEGNRKHLAHTAIMYDWVINLLKPTDAYIRQ